MGNTPWSGRKNVKPDCPTCPAVYVNWDDAQEFIKILNREEGGGRYRLPTEAEWEYAARAGSSGVYCFGDDTDRLRDYAWFRHNAHDAGQQYAHAVGGKKPNAWGLYDMYGNVREWVQDWYKKGYYSSSPGGDPLCEERSDSSRVQRGGSWFDSPGELRSASRHADLHKMGDCIVGFRLVREVDVPDGSSLSAGDKARAEAARREQERKEAEAARREKERREAAARQKWDASGGGKRLTNSIGMTFVEIPAGSFMMGNKLSPEETASRFGGEAAWCNDEQPRHKVTISRSFYMQTTEVTQAQWRAVMGTNPSYFKNCGGDCPVEKVNWNGAQRFVRRLNRKEGGSKYRLPTEAEWEYAARAGSTGAYCFGDDKGQLGDYAWFRKNAWSAGQKYAHAVGGKKPNRWGLYDMHGNVWEWVQDWYQKGYYSSSPKADPLCKDSASSLRVVRGGSWGSGAGDLRSASRFGGPPADRSRGLGFRLVREK